MEAYSHRTNVDGKIRDAHRNFKEDQIAFGSSLRDIEHSEQRGDDEYGGQSVDSFIGDVFHPAVSIHLSCVRHPRFRQVQLPGLRAELDTFSGPTAGPKGCQSYTESEC